MLANEGFLSDIYAGSQRLSKQWPGQDQGGKKESPELKSQMAPGCFLAPVIRPLWELWCSFTLDQQLHKHEVRFSEEISSRTVKKYFAFSQKNKIFPGSEFLQIR